MGINKINELERFIISVHRNSKEFENLKAQNINFVLFIFKLAGLSTRRVNNHSA
jgi:hypothetical protein